MIKNKWKGLNIKIIGVERHTSGGGGTGSKTLINVFSGVSYPFLRCENE